MAGACFDCGRRYGDEYGFPDLVVPHDVWEIISPTGDDGGLLCPSCISKRLHAAGFRDVEARFTSGPLRIGFPVLDGMTWRESRVTV
jgi:hypothetical protein